MPRYLVDVNVWLALVHEGHEHHGVARRWFHALGPREAMFCRQTQLGTLRLLTNEAVMRDSVQTMSGAWQVVDGLGHTGRVGFVEEPPETEKALRALTGSRLSSPKFWSDAYLIAVSERAGLKVATFDKALAEYGVLVV